MKVTKEKAAEHRERMLQAACRLFRERGFDRVGIPEIARAADLTHGAFYTHFASKDAICAQSLERAIEEKVGLVADSGDRSGARKGFVDYYLSEREVAVAATGCPLAALAGEASRQTREVRSAFERALRRFVGTIAPLFAAGTARRRNQATLAATAMLVGG